MLEASDPITILRTAVFPLSPLCVYLILKLSRSLYSTPKETLASAPDSTALKGPGTVATSFLAWTDKYSPASVATRSVGLVKSMSSYTFSTSTCQVWTAVKRQCRPRGKGGPAQQHVLSWLAMDIWRARPQSSCSTRDGGSHLLVVADVNAFAELIRVLNVESAHVEVRDDKRVAI